MYQKIRKFLKSKKAAGSIETSIKVVTAVILGALILIGTYGVVNEVVLPATNSKVTSLFAYSSEGGSDAGGGGSNAPTSTVLEAGKTVPTDCKFARVSGIEKCEICSYEFNETPSTCYCQKYKNLSYKLTVFNEGDIIPDDFQLQVGDIFEDLDYDYIYMYKQSSDYDTDDLILLDKDGWGVKVKTNKASYGAIYSNILGKPVISLSATFANCTNLTNAPILPSTIIDMSYAFIGCTNMVIAPVIPENVTNITNAFNGCTKLAVAPVIPCSVTEMACVFRDCTNLTGLIEINGNPYDYIYCIENTQISGVTGSTSLTLSDLKS